MSQSRDQGNDRYSRFIPDSRVRHRFSAGFTLWEMLLVLFLLTMITAVSWPAISRLFAEDNLRKSLSRLQLKFATARIQAIERQIPYQFCYEPSGRRFIIVPASPSATSSPSSKTPVADSPWIAAEELPDGCRLESRTITQNSPLGNPSTTAPPQSFEIPEEWLSGIENPERFRGIAWSSPLLIRPDGTATAAELTLIDERNQEYRILVRSLTGTLLPTIPSRKAPSP